MTKVKKIRSVKFTKIANEIFDDYRLSYKEIGIYCNMMKFPEDWEFSIRYLADCHHDKKGSVRSGIDTLLKYGYIARDQSRNKRGRFESVDYLIFEDPTDNPYYIPCPPRSEPTNADDSPLTENWTPVNSQKSGINAGKDPENDENRDLPRVKNRYAVETGESAPLTEKRDADNRDAVFPPAENQTQQNTVLTNTFLTNIEEEEDIAPARVNIDTFKQKMMNTYLSSHFSCQDEKQSNQLNKAFNAIANALEDITDPVAVEAINSCTREEAGGLLEHVYRQLYSTKLGEVLRDDIVDKHAYLVKMIGSRFKSSYGGDPLVFYGIRR